MEEKSAQAVRLHKRSVIAVNAPAYSIEYRAKTKMTQAAFARALGIHAPAISAMENHGRISNWRVAEAVLIFAGVDFNELGIEETPGLRDLCNRFLREDFPINVEFNEA